MAFQLQPVYIGNNNMMNGNPDYQMDLDQMLAYGKANNLLGNIYGLPKEEQLSDEQIKSNIINGLNMGNKYISDWQTANNIRKPQDEEEIALAEAGQFNTPTLSTALTQEQKMPERNSFMEGYRENYNNAFSPANWQRNPNKNWQYRLGEGLGTVGRFIDSPVGRGLIAAGLNKALGYEDSMLEGLQAFGTRQNAVTADKFYRNELVKNYGYSDDDLAGIRGNITPDLFKTLTANAYKIRNLDQNTYIKMRNLYDKQLQNRILTPEEYEANMQALNSQFINSQARTMEAGNVQESNQTINTKSNIEYRDKRLEQYDKQLALIDKKIAQTGANSAQRIDLAKQRIEILKQKEQAKQEEKAEKERIKREKAADLAEYNQILKGKDNGAKEYARNSYIQKYGEDPMKKLEMTW